MRLLNHNDQLLKSYKPLLRHERETRTPLAGLMIAKGIFSPRPQPQAQKEKPKEKEPERKVELGRAASSSQPGTSPVPLPTPVTLPAPTPEQKAPELVPTPTVTPTVTPRPPTPRTPPPRPTVPTPPVIRTQAQIEADIQQKYIQDRIDDQQAGVSTPTRQAHTDVNRKIVSHLWLELSGAPDNKMKMMDVIRLVSKGLGETGMNTLKVFEWIDTMKQYFQRSNTEVWLTGDKAEIKRAIDCIVTITPHESHAMGRDLQGNQRHLDYRQKAKLAEDNQVHEQPDLVLFQLGANSYNQCEAWKQNYCTHYTTRNGCANGDKCVFFHTNYDSYEQNPDEKFRWHVTASGEARKYNNLELDCTQHPD